jgi:hypothetical protein
MTVLVVQQGIPFPPAPLTDDLPPPPPPIPIDGELVWVVTLAILMAFYFVKRRILN